VDILKDTEAYPEGPVITDKCFSPIHAAAGTGNTIKLSLLLHDYAMDNK